MFRQPTTIAGFAISAVVAHAVLAQTPTTAAGESDDAVKRLEQFDQPENPVDNAESLVAIGEYPEAINIVELEIDKIERRSSRYNIDLARPLAILGDALAGVGDREGALGAYGRAVHITRVNRGLHHPSQVDIVYREAKVLAANGKVSQANRRHEYAYDILLRSYGGGSPMLLPGVFSLADWYLVNYNIFSARGLYEHALSVADETLAEDDPGRLRALRGVAATYRSERFPPYQEDRKSNSSHQVGYRYGTMPAINNFAKGERALIEVVNVIMASEGATEEDVAGAVLELGDWYLVFGKQDRATTLYRHVWELLQSKPDRLAEIFDSPKPLYLPLPGDPDSQDAVAGRPESGVVELSFRVDESGGVSSIATLHSEPQDLMDVKVRRAVRRARYRPAFDGQTTLATEDVRVSHEFFYYPTDDFPSGNREQTGAANHPVGALWRSVSSVQAPNSRVSPDASSHLLYADAASGTTTPIGVSGRMP
ncbi:MAG: tetratricopeptide repeat protein [Gammaproteobacteria bacterium]|nr:tetratricopeptide repeat protein [Gammaproteobacteria bacterium]